MVNEPAAGRNEQIPEARPVGVGHDVELQTRDLEQDAQAEVGALHTARERRFDRVAHVLGLPVHAVQTKDLDIQPDRARPEVRAVEGSQLARAVLGVHLGAVLEAARVEAGLIRGVPGQVAVVGAVQRGEELGVFQEQVFGMLVARHGAAVRVHVVAQELRLASRVCEPGQGAWLARTGTRAEAHALLAEFPAGVHVQVPAAQVARFETQHGGREEERVFY